MPEMSKELRSALITTFNVIANRRLTGQDMVGNVSISDAERANLYRASSDLSTELIKESTEGGK